MSIRGWYGRGLASVAAALAVAACGFAANNEARTSARDGAGGAGGVSGRPCAPAVTPVQAGPVSAAPSARHADASARRPRSEPACPRGERSAAAPVSVASRSCVDRRSAR